MATRSVAHRKPAASQTYWRLAGAVALVSAFIGSATYAHHSIAAVYDSRSQVTIDAVVAVIHFVSPHPFLTVEVVDDAGERREWRLEMDNLRELVAIGFTSETLKPLDRVVVSGSPSRQQARRLYIRRLDRPSDRFSYEQVGGTPRIRRRS
jgi:hypothetical protein